MLGYAPGTWAPFFTAMIAAAAALTGLLFVAVSINLALILKGSELRSQLRHRRQNSADPLMWTVSRMAGTGVTIIPCAVAGFSLALHGGGGFYWPAPAAMLGIVGAVYNAWVLLVEIVR